jgi:hypothetical protein
MAGIRIGFRIVRLSPFLHRRDICPDDLRNATFGGMRTQPYLRGISRVGKDADSGGGGAGGPGNWLAILLLAALVVGGLFVINAIMKQVHIQNCVLSGRRDCVEIVPSGQ